jgi:hypothetical protein
MKTVQNQKKRRPVVRATGLLSLVVALLMGLSLTVLTVHAQDTIDIEGRVQNGTAGKETPPGLTITLQVFSSGQLMDTRETVGDDQGVFLFEGVEGGDSIGYIISARYAEVPYFYESDYPLPPGPVELIVYEGDGSIDAIVTTVYTLIVDRIDSTSRVVGVSELVGLTNIDDRTFVPDISDAGSMDFLRFSLPLNTTGLEVQSDMQGGQLIFVAQGFALTTPVTPGIHEIRYSYLSPYQDGKMTFTHSFPYGADTFRVLLSQGLGRVSGTGLQEVEPLVFGDAAYWQLETHGLEVGARVTLEFTGLAQPSWWQRFRDALPGGNLTKWALSGTFGLVLVALLAHVLIGRRPWLGAAPVILEGAGQHHDIIEAMARLDDRFQRRELGMDEYLQQRRELRERILR